MQVCYVCSQRPVLSSGPARLFPNPASDPQLVRSGQVKSEFLMCTFRASCCSARLSRAQVPAFAGSSVRNRKKSGEGVRGDHLHWRVQGSTSSPTGINSRQKDALNTFYFTVIWHRTYGKGPFR